MALLRNLIGGLQLNWHFSTSSPEMEVSGASSADTLRLAGLAAHGRPLRDFTRRHHLLIRALVLTLCWEVVAECIGLLAVTIFPPSSDRAAFLQAHAAFGQGQYPLAETI